MTRRRSIEQIDRHKYDKDDLIPAIVVWIVVVLIVWWAS